MADGEVTIGSCTGRYDGSVIAQSSSAPLLEAGVTFGLVLAVYGVPAKRSS